MLLRQRRAIFNFCTRSASSVHETLKRIMMEDNDLLFNTLTPPKIVEELNKRVIGQTEAKEYVAIAFRNRLRRLKVPE